MMPSKSCKQNRVTISVGTDKNHTLNVLIQIPFATTSDAWQRLFC
jgi:hypothetical protein